MHTRWTTGIVVAVLLLAAATPLRPATDAAPSDGDVSSDPRVAEALGLLEAWVEAERAYLDIPGISMALVHGEDVFWSKGFGLAHRRSGAAAAPDTLYSICSISKLFTSLAVMQLRDEGKLRLDEPIATYLPWFDLRQAYDDSPAITLRGILTHSSGLPRESAQPYWTGPDFPFPTREALIAGLHDQQTLYPADRYFQYSNLGLTLAGEVVAAVSGQPYTEYEEERILHPLGLEDTTPWLPEAERGKRLATGYARRPREGEREALPFFEAKAITPAAGYASSALDLARFAAWQLRLLDQGGRDVIAATTLREMQHVHWMDPDWKTSRGLGFEVRRQGDVTMVGHGGGCPGFRTDVSVSPSERFGVAFMSNAIDTPVEIFVRGAHDLVVPALVALDKRRAAAGGEGEAASAAAAAGAAAGSTPAFDAARYTGLYQSVWSEAVVVPWEGGLAMVGLPTDTPTKALVKLRHVEGDTFRRVREDDGELAEAVTFETDGSGRVVRVRRHGNALEREP